MSFPFAAAIASIEDVLARRDAIVERIESRLLNVKGKDGSRRRDRPYFESMLDACVVGAPGMPRESLSLREGLAAAQVADGFEVMFRDTYAHRLDAADLVVRAYTHWDAQRWPGASGRLAYAGTIYAAVVIRLLEDLALRIWDEGDAAAPARLHDVQRLLDRLNAAQPATALLRDAHWLVQTAQGPITRQLAPYFRVAAQVASSFPEQAGVPLHEAGARLAGGHLRSQLRQRASELDRPPDGPDVLVVTRNSNAMDLALLVWDLVPLLEAYRAACRSRDAARRRLADAILQGCSADPELLLTRLDLLAPCTTIETVFVHLDDAGQPALTPAGTRHMTILARYCDLIDGAAAGLVDDLAASTAGSYSPFGLVYGFCADLMSKMALATLHGQAARPATLEDLFVSGGSAETARAVERCGIEYSAEWGAESVTRVARALERRAAHQGRGNASAIRDASLLIVAAGATEIDAAGRAQEYLVTSDVNLALATGATAFPRSQFAIDRNEGRFLASAETDGRWFGISKAVITERIAQGEDALVTGVPQNVVDVLRLTWPGEFPTANSQFPS